MSEMDEISAQLLPLGEYTLLLPNGVVAEILRQVPLETGAAGAPDWVVGTFPWQGLAVPLVSFTRLLKPEMKAPESRKCVIVKTLDPDAPLPCYALQIESFPQFVGLQRHGLLLDASNDHQPNGIRTAVLVGGKTAIVPDLDYIEELLAQWLSSKP